MRLHWLHIALLLALTACKAPEPLASAGIMSVGHGGAGFDTYRNSTPPNTFAALERGLLIEGADAVEIDIQMTADSVLVLHHDASLDASTHCGGCIPSLQWADLAECKVIGRNGPPMGSFPIPALDSVFAQFDDGKVVFFLNVKTNFPCTLPDADVAAFRARFARALGRSIRARGLQERTFVETYDLEMLAACRAHDSEIRIIHDEDNFELAFSRVQALGYEGMAVVNEAITAEQVQTARDAGIFLVIWGVRVQRGTQEAVSKSPDAIMTDDLRMLHHALKR